MRIGGDASGAGRVGAGVTVHSARREVLRPIQRNQILLMEYLKSGQRAGRLQDLPAGLKEREQTLGQQRIEQVANLVIRGNLRHTKQSLGIVPPMLTLVGPGRTAIA